MSLMLRISAGLMIALLALSGCDNGKEPPANEVAAPAPSAPVSNWETSQKSDAVTDVITRFAMLSDGGGHSLVLRQVGKRLECYITTPDFLETIDNLHSRNSAVQYRFDSEKPTRAIWSISDDNTSLFCPSNPKGFVNRLRNAHTFAFRYSPADKMPVSLSFNVQGLPDGFGK